MVLAKELMTQEVITVTEDTPVSEAARLMTEKHISGLPVLNSRKELVGIVCESDIIDQSKQLHLPTVLNLMGNIVFLESSRKLEKELKKMTGLLCRDIMSAPVQTVAPDAPMEMIATLMADRKVHSIPVVEGKALKGIIGKKDLVRSLAR
jgi:CBS domain-containing protein